MTVKVWYDISRDDLSLLQYTDSPDGRIVVSQDGTYRVFKKNEPIPRECCISIREPVELLDELLKAGYRPSDNKWTGGHVKALENHIAFAEGVANRLLWKE